MNLAAGRVPPLSNEGRTPEESTPTPQAERKGPIVVGIGASAGGLAALKSFFEHVPEDSGLSFVVVVHLSAQHESHLADLLQFRVKIPVQQVTENEEILPNRVYVIPPGYNISAIDTHLRLSRLEGRSAARAPIDHFFRTLAATHDGHAIGVILTGTGSDGTSGVKEVKARGGMVIVQDPNEAEFDGMPQSAISTGLADLVLPVAQIPAALQRIASTAPRVSLPPEGRDGDRDQHMVLQKIFSLLRGRTSRDFSNYKESTTLRRISRRMQLNYVENLATYYEKLRTQPDEVRALADDLLITVTNFFRDHEVFELLEKEVISRLFDGKGADGTIRAWSVGCATGEEPYSLAMLLLEEAGRSEVTPRIQIFATDLHEPSLVRAREGFFSKDIENDVDPVRLRRFFQKQHDGYLVRKEIREPIVFSAHNIMADPPFSRLDLILCRNLLIYLQPNIQDDIIKLFHYALKPSGFLVLGPSENVKTSDLFRPVGKSQKIVQKRNVPAPEPHLPMFPWTKSPMALPVPRTTGGVEPPSYSSLHLRLVERYSPPSLLVGPDDKIVHLSEHAGRYLVQPGGEVTHNIIKLVRDELRIELLAALQAARSERREIVTKAVPVQFNGDGGRVVMRVRPELEEQEGFVLVTFEDGDGVGKLPPAPPEEKQKLTGSGKERQQELESDLLIMQRRLQAVIDQYETSQEEMKASNEELQSTNEELRSTLEELETSKEELQSMNEELQTVNQENRHKVEELALLSNDLQNLLTATEIATLFLDRDCRILRFTPKLVDLFNVRMMDRGRPLTDFTHHLGETDILKDARSVLASLVSIDREVQDESGRWYVMSVRPYRSTEDRIEGTVITFVDITARKRAEIALRESDQRLERELETLAKLHRMFLSVVSAPKFDDAAAKVLETSIDLVQADFGNVQVVTDENCLKLVTQQGFDQEFCDRFAEVSAEEETSCGRALRTRKRVMITDVTSEPTYAPYRQAAAKAGYRAVQSTPLIDSTGKVMGVFSTHFRQPRTLSDHDGQVLDLLAKGASALLERLRSEHEVRQLAASLERRVEERTAELREKEQDVRRLASETIMVEQGERNRIAQVLHDDLQQLLFGVEMKIRSCEKAAKARRRDELATQMTEAHSWVKRSIDLTQQLSMDLNPQVLQQDGFEPALKWLAEHMKELHGLNVKLKGDTHLRLPFAMRALLFSIVRELLFNVIKHAQTDCALVELAVKDDQIRLGVSDKGRGFDMKSLEEHKGYGLSHLERRLLPLNGKVKLASSPGEGTSVTISLPLEVEP